MSPDSDRKWLALILLCAVQFMVVLDVAIVNVALPTIKNALDFSDANLQWVVSAYTLTFGGFLMLGSRIADLLGRKRLFIAGLVLFSAASLACGLSQSDTQLIVVPRHPGPWRRGDLTGRAGHPHHHLPPRARSGTRHSPSGAPSPARAAPWACCWAASSPTRSAGSGSSS